MRSSRTFVLPNFSSDLKHLCHKFQLSVAFLGCGELIQPSLPKRSQISERKGERGREIHTKRDLETEREKERGRERGGGGRGGGREGEREVSFLLAFEKQCIFITACHVYVVEHTCFSFDKKERQISSLTYSLSFSVCLFTCLSAPCLSLLGAFLSRPKACKDCKLLSSMRGCCAILRMAEDKGESWCLVMKWSFGEGLKQGFIFSELY